MKLHKWSDVKNGRIPKEELAAAKQRAASHREEVSLRLLRERLGVTQRELADKGGMDQAEVSRMERRPDMMVSTIRRYLEALGYELEIAAVKDKRRIVISGPHIAPTRA
jgi:predicted transcriptional regulator